jgi:hypothetical protein
LLGERPPMPRNLSFTQDVSRSSLLNPLIAIQPDQDRSAKCQSEVKTLSRPCGKGGGPSERSRSSIPKGLPGVKSSRTTDCVAFTSSETDIKRTYRPNDSRPNSCPCPVILCQFEKLQLRESLAPASTWRMLHAGELGGLRARIQEYRHTTKSRKMST